jgi:hypothetical protein
MNRPYFLPPHLGILISDIHRPKRGTLWGLVFGGLVAWLSSGADLAQANDAQFIRIRADAPTTITGITRDGQISWTNALANARYTIETRPSGPSNKWGSVVSGVQTGIQSKVRVDLTSYGKNVISVRATYSTMPLPNFEMVFCGRIPIGPRSRAV